jgi:hypothetical protein
MGSIESVGISIELENNTKDVRGVRAGWITTRIARAGRFLRSEADEGISSFWHLFGYQCDPRGRASLCPCLEDMSSMTPKDNGPKGQGTSRTISVLALMTSKDNSLL